MYDWSKLYFSLKYMEKLSYRVKVKIEVEIKSSEKVFQLLKEKERIR